MESGNLMNNNNFENRQQNKNNPTSLLMTLEKAIQESFNSDNNSAAKDPRKNKKK